MVDLAHIRALEADDQPRVVFLRAIPLSGPLQVGHRLGMDRTAAGTVSQR